MSQDELIFDVHSGGSVTIDLTLCPGCSSKACLDVCGEQGGPLVLHEARAVPELRGPLEQVENGGCVECLGCELACELHGHQAVVAVLPIEGFDEYLTGLSEPVVTQRGA